MRHLILVRHAQPQIVIGVPAREWRLSDEGRAACLALAGRLAPFRPGALASSEEPKALETAQIVGDRLGVSVMPVAGLHEHERGPVRDLDQRRFEASVAAFFAHPQELVLGEETGEQARTRFTEAVEGIVRTHPGGDVVVVAHGTVITLYAAPRLGVRPFPLWQRLKMPDVIILPLVPDANQPPP